MPNMVLSSMRSAPISFFMGLLAVSCSLHRGLALTPLSIAGGKTKHNLQLHKLSIATTSRIPFTLTQADQNDSYSIRIDDKFLGDLPMMTHQATHMVASYPTTVPPTFADEEKANVPWDIMRQRYVLRLNTYEDRQGTHKLSSIVWMLSGFFILGTGISNEFSIIPNSLEVPTWLFLASSAMQSFSGIVMALKYRSDDPVVQKGFINAGCALTNLAYICLYLSPFASEQLNNFWLGNGLFILTSLPLVFLGVYECLHLFEMLERRKIRSKESSAIDFGLLADMSSYGVAIIVAFIGAAAGVFVAASPDHDRAWLVDAASRGAFASPHFLAENYFSIVLYNLATGFGSLAITLRDKKLISKSIEQTMVAFFVFPGIFLTLHSLV
jgi:hypothetical protein